MFLPQNSHVPVVKARVSRDRDHGTLGRTCLRGQAVGSHHWDSGVPQGDPRENPVGTWAQVCLPGHLRATPGLEAVGVQGTCSLRAAELPVAPHDARGVTRACAFHPLPLPKHEAPACFLCVGHDRCLPTSRPPAPLSRVRVFPLSGSSPLPVLSPRARRAAFYIRRASGAPQPPTGVSPAPGRSGQTVST